AKTNLDDPNRTYIGERLKDEFKNIALYGIDGPANVRETPNGKVIGSIENGAYVWVLLKKGDWYKIAYNNLTGWTHKKNLVDVWDVKKYNENKGND
ncbi:MAG: SH3 domain-containing protein, partial [Endomicrobia bacterium]|nr:SH3 domain-containing protein [Endomicrobiia bacterium]